MKNIYRDVTNLDKICYKEYEISEDILMENASITIKNHIENLYTKAKILIMVGSGNNGGDGLALARMLKSEFEIDVLLIYDSKTEISKLQLKRLSLINRVNFISEITKNYDIVVDCIFGSGLSKPLENNIVEILKKINHMEAYKIACDVPTGIDINGNYHNIVFIANTTITMGALKLSLFADNVKDFVGDIIVADLGLPTEIYQKDTNMFLLEKSDMNLPIRLLKNTNKFNFGHLSIISGEKSGASILSGLAGLNFGAGLVTLIREDNISIPFELMKSSTIPNNSNTLLIGMGLGNTYSENEILSFFENIDNIIIDADMFHMNYLKDILQMNKNFVLTPHPKEFSSLMKNLGIGNYSIEYIQANRFNLAFEFSKHYPDVVLLLKGANTVIAHNNRLYINNLGDSRLSKAGSGDVLGGMIASLVAQGYKTVDATITASLAHSTVPYSGNNYSMTPLDIIEGIKYLNLS